MTTITTKSQAEDIEYDWCDFDTITVTNIGVDGGAPLAAFTIPVMVAMTTFQIGAVAPANTAPVFFPLTAQRVKVTTLLEFSVAATDAEERVSLTADGLPQGMLFDRLTGRAS